MSIKVFIRNDYQELSIKAAEIVEETVSDNPFPVLGLATGKTPTGLYRQLVADYSRGIISFSNVKTVNLDEYAGLSADDTRSFAFFPNASRIVSSTRLSSCSRRTIIR